MKNTHYSWDQFGEDTKIIAGLISSSGYNIDKIYGIKRGGSFLAISLSYLLDKDVEIIESDKKIDNNNKNILLVDDICDSGETFKNLVGNNTVKTASIFYNIKQNFLVDYFARKIDRDYDKNWIVFPWEMNT